ncbi:TPA: hypothetical protein DEP21_05285 [Patescibacteria group bacterium]|nr:hypothetical protein [Candidatus Gracilibacteria bacterium]
MIIAAIGTANKIHVTPIINPQRIIQMKITTVFTPRDLFISTGVIIFASNVLIRKITQVIITQAQIP